MALAALEVVVLAVENGADFPLSVPYLRRNTGEVYLDMCAFCSSGEVLGVVERLGTRGRELQALILPTVDVVIPLLSFLFGLALLGALLEGRAKPDRRRWLLLGPALALALDLAENATIGLLLAGFPGRMPVIAGLVGVLSGLKFVCYLCVLGVGAALAVERAAVGLSRRVPR